MKRLRSLLATVAIGVAAAACTDSPQTPVTPSPSAKPSADLITGTVKSLVTGVQWKQPLTADVSASAVVGPGGGWVELPQVGAHLYVPAGAVAAPTTFTITALAGSLVAYEFQPAGSRFTRPLRLVQDQSYLTSTGAPPGVSLLLTKLGYFSSPADLDQAHGSAAVSELQTTLVISTPRQLIFPIWHFSGYIVCWG
jgi:hypothetical protein